MTLDTRRVSMGREQVDLLKKALKWKHRAEGTMARYIPKKVKTAWAKVPSETKTGMKIGAATMLPGATEAGAALGTGVWAAKKAQNAIEDRVRKHTGQPWRMFSKTEDSQIEDRFAARKDEAVRVSPKLDGVFARATRDGTFSKSGKPLVLPHIRAALSAHFAKHPESELKGELYRQGLGVEKIAGAARAGGNAAKRLQLHLFPDQGTRPKPGGPIRRVTAKTAHSPEEVDALFNKALALGHEGAMIRHKDGKIEKRKPKQDAEYEALTDSAGPRGVLHVRDGDGRRFKVQGPGVSAKVGDKVQVTYSGTTAKGVPKGAVARRVRNDNDFSAMGHGPMAMGPEGGIHYFMKTDDQEQVKKDRRSLLKGALVAAGGLGALAYIAHKSRGGVVGQEPWVPKVKKDVPLKGASGARANSVRKYGTDDATERGLKADKLKRHRAWGAMPTAEKGWGKRLAKQKPEVQAKAEALWKRGSKGSAVTVKPALSLAHATPNEVAQYQRGLPGIERWKRQEARQGLQKLRETKGFDTPANGMIHFEKDKYDHARDASIGAGALASGGAAVYGAREWGKTNKALRNHADEAAVTLKDVGKKLQPKEIAREGIKQVKRAGKDKLKEYFPTFIKAGQALKRKVFSTPASGLFEFAGGQQLRDPDDETFVNPLRVASGMARGYYKKTDKGVPIVEDTPVLHGQTVRAALNKGAAIHRTVKRTGSLAKDAADTVMGRARQKDAAGRTKKKEWEKSWFKNKVGEVATAGALLGGTAYLRHSEHGRGLVKKGEAFIVKHARRIHPDAFPKGQVFSTPAGRLIDFDDGTAKNSDWKNATVNTVAGDATGMAVDGGVIGGAVLAAKLARKGKLQGVAGKAALGADEWLTKHPRLSPLAVGTVGTALTIPVMAGLLRHQRKTAAAGSGLLVRGSQVEKKSFATPASRVIRFDAVAEDAGWDVRDPRGRSARVFAPGSGKRERRGKMWHETVENERKLWKAAAITAGAAGLAGGIGIGKRLGKLKTAAAVAEPVLTKTPRVVAGLRSARPKPRWTV